MNVDGCICDPDYRYGYDARCRIHGYAAKRRSDFTEAMGGNLRPGAKIAVQIPGGQLVHHTITEIHRQSGEYMPAPPLPWRARVLRKLTPPRWRKPLPMGTRGPDTMQITTLPVALDDLLSHYPTPDAPPPASGS